MKKNRFTKFRLSPEEQDDLHFAAKKAGLNVSKYIRLCLRAAERKKEKLTTPEPQHALYEQAIISGLVSRAPFIGYDTIGKEHIEIHLDLSHCQPPLFKGPGRINSAVIYSFDVNIADIITPRSFLMASGRIKEILINKETITFHARRIQVQGGLHFMISGRVSSTPKRTDNNISFTIFADEDRGEYEVSTDNYALSPEIKEGALVICEGIPLFSNPHRIYAKRIITL